MVDLHPHHGLSQESLNILEDRAKSLASTTAIDNHAPIDLEKGQTYMVFRYLDERYGIPVSLVNEVVPLSKILAIPGAPMHVVGLTRLRGKILALINLRSFFRRALSGFADADLAVVTEAEGRLFGIVCSKVESLLTLNTSQMDDIPDSFDEHVRRSMVGFADRDIMLLDVKQLLAEEGFVIR